MPKTKLQGKKQLKKLINENGFFCSMEVSIVKNAPAEVASKVPEGATYFEGIVSNGELNRNGYIIRPQALIDSLGVYMENPIILLQHNMDEPIGQALSAKLVGKKGEEQVAVSGYIFDDMTDGAFGRGLLKALSTGHITKAIEFENVKTGEVMSVDEFRKMREEKGYFGDWENDWVMAGTALEWVEFSLVSIPSNRKALITSKNAIDAFFNGNFSEQALRKLNNDTEETTTEEEKVEEEPATAAEPEAKIEEKAESTDESNQPKEGEDAENTGETPEASEETVEKDGEPEGDTAPEAEGNKIKISLADRNRLKAAADRLHETLEATFAEGEEEATPAEAPKAEEKEEPKAEAENAEVEAKPEDGQGEVEEVKENSAKIEVQPEIRDALQALVSMNNELESEVARLNAELAKIPNKKGLAIVTQFTAAKPEAKPEQKGEALISFLRANGFNV